MKFVFALVLASLCVAAHCSPLGIDVSIDAEERGLWESTTNAAKKLQGKLKEALAVAKGKLSEFVKALGEREDVAQVLSELKELKDKLIAEGKQKAKEAMNQALDQAKQQAAQIAAAEIQKLVGDIDGLKEKIDGLMK